MKDKTALHPVTQKERIHVLDALRGFAIFGILVINIGVFSGYSYMTQEARNNLLLAEWNSFFDWIHTVFFSGKFYTIFSFLFGIGFAIQLIRASKTGRSIKSHFSRRLFILLLIGVVHLWGIWFSDILVIYAICGYILILFKNLSSKTLILAAFLLILIPGLHSWYLQTADNSYTNAIYRQLNETWKELNLPDAEDEYDTFQMRDVTEVIQTDSWKTVFSFNYIGPLLRGYIVILDARLFKVLAIFILGLWVGRRILSDRLHENRSLLLRIALIGFAIGIPLNIFYGSEGISMLLLKEAVTPFAYVSLAAAYIAAFMPFYLTWFRKIFTALFNAVGKMALTNYIFQSIACILLFYEVGIGLGKYLGSAYLTLSVFIIFFFQIIISILWLKRYKYGPLEWLWRVLTYGRYLKNRQ